MKRNSHRPLLILAVLIVASAAIGLLRFNSFQVGGYSDDAHYLVLAESLAGGHGYRLINFPDARPEWAFPPGWPILLTPLMALLPGNYDIAKYMSFCLWLASIPLMYRLFVKRIETPYLEILIALIVLNPRILGMSSMVTAEAAYIFFSLLTLWLVEQWEDHQEDGKGWLLIVAFSVAAVYTQLIRTVGISIQLALITYLLLSRRFRQVGLVFVIFILGMLPQFWLNYQNGGSIISSGYQQQGFNNPVGTMLQHAWVNAQGYADYILSNSLVPVFGSNTQSMLKNYGVGFVPVLVNILIMLLIGLGFMLAIKQLRLSELYMIFYFLGLLTFWIPNYGGVQSRFLVPVIPFLYYYFFLGLKWCVRMTVKGERYATLVVGGSAALILLLLMTRNIQDWRNPTRNNITDLSVGTVWVDQNTPSTSIIMSRNPVPDYLYAHRKTVAYPTKEQDVEKYIRDNGVDFIIIAPKLQTPRSIQLGEYVETSLLPVIKSNKDTFRQVYTNSDHNVTVYEYIGR